MPLPRVELRGVSKTYRNPGQEAQASQQKALDDISLSFYPGSVTALLGRSGCGKTTLLNLAGAMDFPTAGEVLIDGRGTSSLNDDELTALRRRRVGFVFQSFQLLPTLTVLENVELPLLLSRAAKSAATARDRLRWVELEEMADRFPYQLSGGQMQRVAIARALAQAPELLIADEPTGNLDNSSGNRILTLLRQSAAEFGAAVIMATHSAEAASIADVRVSLRDGRIGAIDAAGPAQ